MFEEKGKRYLRAVRPFSFIGPAITVNLGAILPINSFFNIFFDVRRFK